MKCDLGSVDNPGDPPCVRCRRESKECYFSATRRKRKTEDGKEESLDGYDFGDEYVVRNGRKMVHASPPASIRQGSMGAPTSARSDARYTDAPVIPGPPLTPGGSIGRTQPLRRPGQDPEQNQRYGGHADEANTQLENLEAQEVMRREVYGPHDALDLLYKAATDRYVPDKFPARGRCPDRSKVLNDSDSSRDHLVRETDANLCNSPGHKRAARESHGSSQMSPMHGNNVRNQPLTSPMQNNNQSHHQNSMQPPELPRDTAIDPELSGMDKPDRMQDQGYKDALKAWSRFRFVRAGWFTPQEAIDYIE